MDSRYRHGKYSIDREVLDEQRLEELTQRKPYADTQLSVFDQLKDSMRCTLPRLKRGVLSTFPVLYWLPKYSIWDYGMPDLISGISVGIMHLPQGMAYALLASLPPVFGLYTSLYPALVYFFFGTSRHISIGTFAVLSIMVGSVTERLAPDIAFLQMNGTNITIEVDISARDSYRLQVAAATTVLAGLIQVVLGFVKFGFVGMYFSEPLVRAYTTAAAAHAVASQLKYIFGVSPTRFNGPLSLVYTLKDVCLLLPQTHLPTLAVSAVSMVFLIAAKELNSFLSPKLPVPIPVELITIVAATLISNYGHLNSNYTVPVVGEIPNGSWWPWVLAIRWGASSSATLYVPPCLGVSFRRAPVGKHKPTYSILGNVDGSELYVDIETHKEAREIPGVMIFRSSATVYFANAELYLGALKEKSGLNIGKMIIYKRRQEAKEKRRQKRAERRAKRQAKRERCAEQATVFSVEEEAKTRGRTEKDEQNWAERENGTVFVKPTTLDDQCRWEYLKGIEPDSTSLGWMSVQIDRDATTLGSSSEDTLSRDLERISLGSLGKWSWDIHSIILDLSTANFIDTVAIKTMKNIFQDFSEIDVDVYLAGCQASVVQQLELGHFFSESITKRHLFASVHDAVLFCLDHRGASLFGRYERSLDMDGSTKL
ncbi:solute carrier family 26 member 6, like isoform X3 [Entelurus aequoreus]|uniref:solute carrier family 26 member 6, like isoform X3 n=1 Tax=Entelurus aequoreus TaxID=161455 RepID=UPI002B1D4F13|nr:solute carrier family 26 member 6, like isoform X3 [Entelurus aequoreus]